MCLERIWKYYNKFEKFRKRKLKIFLIKIQWYFKINWKDFQTVLLFYSMEFKSFIKSNTKHYQKKFKRSKQKIIKIQKKSVWLNLHFFMNFKEKFFPHLSSIPPAWYSKSVVFHLPSESHQPLPRYQLLTPAYHSIRFFITEPHLIAQPDQVTSLPLFDARLQYFPIQEWLPCSSYKKSLS